MLVLAVGTPVAGEEAGVRCSGIAARWAARWGSNSIAETLTGSALPKAEVAGRCPNPAGSVPGVRLVYSTIDAYAYSVRADSGRVYAATNAGIEIYEPEPTAGLVRIGGLSGESGFVLLDVRGRWALGVDLGASWLLVDVSDPTQPQEVLWACEGDPWAVDVAVGTSFAAIAGEGEARILDLRGEPREVRGMALRPPIRADGSRLLTGDGSYWDLADPENPVRLAGPQREPAYPGSGSLDIEDGIALFTEPGEIWSYADPTRPEKLATLPNSPWAVCLSGRSAYLQVNGRIQLEAWSLDNPRLPELRGVLPGGWGIALDAVDDRVYWVAREYEGVETVDVSDPASMIPLGQTAENAETPWRIAMKGQWLAAAVYVSGQAEIRLWEVANPAAPVRVPVPSVGTGHWIGDLKVVGNLLAVSRRSGVWPEWVDLFDLSGKDVRLAGSWPGNGFSLGPGLLAVEDQASRRFELFRIPDGGSPVPLGSPPGNWGATTFAGARLLAQDGGSRDLAIFDFTQPAPSLVGRVSVEGGSALEASEQTLVRRVSCDVGGCGTQSTVFDLSDSSHPVELIRWGIGSLESPFAGRALSSGFVGTWATQWSPAQWEPLTASISWGQQQGGFAIDEERGLLAVASGEVLRIWDISEWQESPPCTVFSRLTPWVSAACSTSEVDLVTHSVRTRAGDGCEGRWQWRWTLDGVVEPNQAGPTFRVPVGLSPGVHSLVVNARCPDAPLCPDVVESMSFVVDAPRLPPEVEDLMVTKSSLAHRLDLGWSAATAVWGWVVEAAHWPRGPWRWEETVTAPTTQSSDFPGADQYFRVRATNGCGVGP